MTTESTTGSSADQGRGPGGSEETKRFYDEQGWTANDDGQLVDVDLFGTKEDGPIRIELYETYQRRVREAIGSAGAELDLLECGCGGSPELDLLDLCSHYTGVDFSETGLAEAALKLKATGVAHRLQQADVCDLPFADGHFDAVYSARMIFHIPDPAAQARAVDEMLRVLKPGGVLVLVTANPFPLLFPERSLKRLVAIAPVLGPLANRLRPPPPLPYEPMPLGWFRRRIGNRGSVDMISAGFQSQRFHQRVSEHRGLGRFLWRAILFMERRFPRGSVRLGNYAQITVVKR
jgi:SAM-dependent methyltransferase